jgi:hypothetical protein
LQWFAENGLTTITFFRPKISAFNASDQVLAAEDASGHQPYSPDLQFGSSAIN